MSIFRLADLLRIFDVFYPIYFFDAKRIVREQPMRSRFVWLFFNILKWIFISKVRNFREVPADFLETLLSSSSHNPAYVPGLTFGFVKLLASSGSHCTKWADEQHRPARFESRHVPDLPLPFIPTLISLRAFDLVSSRVCWEAATNKLR